MGPKSSNKAGYNILWHSAGPTQAAKPDPCPKIARFASNYHNFVKIIVNS